MVKFRSLCSICKDKRRLGMLALAVSLLLGLVVGPVVGPVQPYTMHFVRGLFLGMALAWMMSDLYQRNRRSL